MFSKGISVTGSARTVALDDSLDALRRDGDGVYWGSTLLLLV